MSIAEGRAGFSSGPSRLKIVRWPRSAQSFRAGEYVDRELVLVKVGVDSKSRAEVMQITDIFRAKIVDVQPKSLTIEITGNGSKVEKFLDLMKTFGVLELTRTGQVAMPRK